MTQTDEALRHQAEEARRMHDPANQVDTYAGRCSLCSYTRHPCEIYDLADEVVGLLDRLRMHEPPDRFDRDAASKLGVTTYPLPDPALMDLATVGLWVGRFMWAFPGHDERAEFARRLGLRIAEIGATTEDRSNDDD
jgi:hypothetical protein